MVALYERKRNAAEISNRKYSVDISGKLPTILCELDTSGSLKKPYVWIGDGQWTVDEGNVYSSIVIRQLILRFTVSTGNDKFIAMAGQIWSLNFILGMEGLMPVNLIGVAQDVAVGFGVDAVYGDYQMSGVSSYLMPTGWYAFFQACAKAFQ